MGSSDHFRIACRARPTIFHQLRYGTALYVLVDDLGSTYRDISGLFDLSIRNRDESPSSFAPHRSAGAEDNSDDRPATSSDRESSLPCAPNEDIFVNNKPIGLMARAAH